MMLHWTASPGCRKYVSFLCPTLCQCTSRASLLFANSLFSWGVMGIVTKFLEWLGCGTGIVEHVMLRNTEKGFSTIKTKLIHVLETRNMAPYHVIHGDYGYGKVPTTLCGALCFLFLSLPSLLCVVGTHVCIFYYYTKINEVCIIFATQHKQSSLQTCMYLLLLHNTSSLQNRVPPSLMSGRPHT